MFQILPIAYCPVTGCHLEESASAFFNICHQVFILMDKLTLTLLFTKLNNPSSQALHVAWMLQSLIHDSLQYVCFFLVLGTVLQVQPRRF